MDATPGEIQEAYHKKKLANGPARVDAKAKEINYARDVLRGRVRRPSHDRSHYCTVLGVGPNCHRARDSESVPEKGGRARKQSRPSRGSAQGLR